MRPTICKCLTLVSGILLAGLAVVGGVLAQGPTMPNLAGAIAAQPAASTMAFSYQGQLKDNGIPANGSYTMTFRLWDAESAGNPASNPMTQTVGVSGGIFITQLDFGAAPFNGQRRWLEVGVNGSLLNNRQEITPAPYAIAAYNGVPAGTMIASASAIPPAGYSNSGMQIHAADTGTWRRRAPVPTVRHDFAAAELDGKIYALGGLDNTGAITNVVEVFNPVANAWSAVASMPTSRALLAAAAGLRKVYAIGGAHSVMSPPLATVEAYDPVGNAWSAPVSIPRPRHDLAAVACNRKIYAMGGLVLYDGGILVPLADVDEYDPLANVWTSKAPLPVAGGGLAVAVLGDKIYAFGGNSQGTGATRTVQVYDPLGNTWSTDASPMPFAVFEAAAAVLDGKIYVIGGGDMPVLQIYDPVTDTWTLELSPMTQSLAGAATISGRIYIVDSGGGVMEYTPPVALYLHQKQ